MNFTLVDLGPWPRARVGDRAVLLDDDQDSPASVYGWAEALGTIPYDVLTSIGSTASVRVIDETGMEACHEDS